ncbi:RNA-directed DNA polymerase [Vibrio alginolyticus]|uniref:RNA-directed DNA polymerase n=1 Tax=Vibrio alginolyticus TaxID=663 RepID=UPI002160D94F|nr:RNA-directed DNA polymerase [Vibrio alginolyticus]MCS0154873.1 RNA-directed DNA polymerase [Vibrio alginolyticus]
MTLVTEMTAEEAKDFFLKHESYCSFPLPIYFDFEPLLEAVSADLNQKPNGIKDIGYKDACNFEGANYTLQTNKDGHYSWRPFELIHPAIYAHLTHEITKDDEWEQLVQRFDEFQGNEKIVCVSLPRESDDEDTSDTAETVNGWWRDVEQESINKALEFKYLFTTDIASFYPSIYTHSIPWAIHTKEVAKPIRGVNANLGNRIDYALRQMRWGQTNGIPQGSALMDFIAEIVLGYADELLGEKLDDEGIDDYHIIRYRDDYRVFTNSKEDAEAIARHLTVILQGLGLQLNASKTSLSEDVIFNSMKPDKQEALMVFGKTVAATTIQKTLLKLAIFSRKHKNSGQLDRYLAKINKRLERMKKLKEDVRPIVSIIADMMLHNPRTFASCALVLSNVLRFVEEDDEKIELIELVKDKFEPILGTGILDIWLQRISYHINDDIQYRETLCSIVSGLHADPHEQVWNSEWITDNNFKNVIMATPFVDEDELEACEPVIPEDEVVLYPYDIDFDDEEEEEED